MEFKKGDYYKYATYIRETEKRYELPTDLLALTLYQSSEYDPKKIKGEGRNPIGTIGIAALTRDDCKVLWIDGDLRKDALASIVGAAILLRAYYSQFNNWKLSVVAFHSNAQIVRDALQQREKMPIDARRYAQQISDHCMV